MTTVSLRQRSLFQLTEEKGFENLVVFGDGSRRSAAFHCPDRSIAWTSPIASDLGPTSSTDASVPSGNRRFGISRPKHVAPPAIFKNLSPPYAGGGDGLLDLAAGHLRRHSGRGVPPSRGGLGVGHRPLPHERLRSAATPWALGLSGPLGRPISLWTACVSAAPQPIVPRCARRALVEPSCSKACH